MPATGSPGPAAASRATPRWASPDTTGPDWSGGCATARAPFALERIEQASEQQVVYRLPQPQRDGRTALPLTPLAYIDHLAALIPPPRLHRHRYHGVLAPNAPLRLAATAYGRDTDLTHPPPPPAATAPSGRSPAHYLWAMLSPAAGARTPVRVPAAGLPELRCRHAHRRLHYRDRPSTADPHPHRRAGRAAAHQPRARTAPLGRPARRGRTRRGRPGPTATRVRLRPAGAVVAAFLRLVAQATRHSLHPL
ncbi:MAG: transposase [Chromatiaceae bacterium]|nr:transposase [Chromatiaceae bacterium]MBP6734758.1 transposase [Chromatiaceae bacterium]MBP6807964.1 transposase [Chromatiaceae bacterium]MBP8282983.1 transposase [Chromatiaceae bacterium]MBP8289158.1 transposase [Chromatiaceae bacterium]